MVEYTPLKRLVLGSSPSGPINLIEVYMPQTLNQTAIQSTFNSPHGFVILPTGTRPTPEQVNYLNSKFGKGNWSPLNVPVGGWTLSAMKEITIDLKGNNGIAVFATPVDILMRLFVIHGVCMMMFEEALFG